MKKILSILMIVGTAFWLAAPSAFATTATAGPYTMDTSVPSGLTISVNIVDSKNNANLTALHFGPLSDIGTGTLRSNDTTGIGHFTVFLSANSHQLPYTISETATALTAGTATLPSGACTVVPVYSTADNSGQAMPTGAALGAKGTWVSSTPKTIYQSETGNAQMRTVQAIYSITDDPTAGATAGVPDNQIAGTYTGTVTFTATA